MHAPFKTVNIATQAVQSHLPEWQEKVLTPICHFIYTLKWEQLGKNETAENPNLYWQRNEIVLAY